MSWYFVRSLGSFSCEKTKNTGFLREGVSRRRCGRCAECLKWRATMSPEWLQDSFCACVCSGLRFWWNCGDSRDIKRDIFVLRGCLLLNTHTQEKERKNTTEQELAANRVKKHKHKQKQKEEKNWERGKPLDLKKTEMISESDPRSCFLLIQKTFSK